MSDDNFYDDDDFYSDGDKSPRNTSPRGRSPSPKSPRHKNNGLMPIVEVPTPSEGNTSITSPRSDLNGSNTQRTQDDSFSDQDALTSDDNEDVTPRKSTTPSSGRRAKKHRTKTKNGRFHVDMTPPDKLLKKAERKAQRYTDKKKIDKAIKELIRCTALARIVYGDGHWRLARSYVKLAEGYFDLKNYAAQAQYHADFAKSIMLSGVQMSESSTDKASIMDVLVRIYYSLGRANTALKKYPDAEQALNKADKLDKDRARQSPSKHDEDWRIKIYMAMARLAARQQKYAVATTNFEKALDLLESARGQDSVALIPVYQALGRVEQSKERHADHEKAIEHYLQAHSIATANYKDNSVEVAETARALATAYSNVGEEDAETSAESYLNECLGIYQALYGPHHEKTVDIEDDLARLMIRTDREDEGLTLLRSSMEARKEVHGDLSTNVADTWKLMGSVYLKTGDSEKALRAFKKCHNLECTLYGNNNKNSKDTQRTIDLLMANPNLASKQKKTKAEELKERPRFSSIVSRSSTVGQCKVPDY